MRTAVIGGLSALLLVLAVESAAGQDLAGLLQQQARAARRDPDERSFAYSPLIRPNQNLAGELGQGDGLLQNGWIVDQWLYQGARNELAAFTLGAPFEVALAIFLQQGTELKYLGEVEAGDRAGHPRAQAAGGRQLHDLRDRHPARVAWRLHLRQPILRVGHQRGLRPALPRRWRSQRSLRAAGGGR